MVGENDFGVLAAHGQQLVHREGGGAEDGLEGDGVDALSPQLTQRGQRDAEGGCEPSDADGEGVAALGARVGDALAVLVGDSQAGEGKGGCGRGGRAAVRRGRRLFRLHRAGDRDLLGFAISVGGGDFCARVQLVLDGVEVELTAVLQEGLASGTTGLGGQLKAARQIDDAAVDAAAAAGAAVTASGFDRTAGDGDTVEAADAVAADFAAVAASGVDRIAGDGDDAAAADAVAAVAVFAVAVTALGGDRTVGDGEAAAAADAIAADEAAAVTAIGSDRTTAGDGEEGLRKFFEQKPDVLVADVMMPRMDGFEMVRRIRQSDKATPVLFLTARSAINDVVKGFELGANDYLKKPFGMQELIVRLKALMHKAFVEKEITNTYTIGGYQFNSVTQQLDFAGNIQELSHRESEILKRLCENRNEVVNSQSILLELWGDDSFFNSRSLHVFITKLRHKLSKDQSIRIVNVRGIGYKLIIN